jgi:hypothetical protein
MVSSRDGWRAATAAACVSLLGAICASSAADPEIDALRKQMEELKTRIDTLERERSTRFKEPPPADTTIPGDTKTEEAAAAPAMDPGVQLASSWARIERGMDRTQVEALIGSPRETLNIEGRVVWYYVYPRYGRGSVFFTGGQKVSSVQTPQFAWGR